MHISIIKIDIKTQIITAGIHGNFSDQKSNELFRTFIQHYLSQGFCKIILSFSGIRMVNCSAIGCLCTELKRLKAHRGTMVVYELPREIDELFTITRLKKSIKVFTTRQEAYSYLCEGSSAPHTSQSGRQKLISTITRGNDEKEEQECGGGHTFLAL